MIIKNVKPQLKLIKILIATCIFAVVAIASTSIFVSNQANADSVIESNDNVFDIQGQLIASNTGLPIENVEVRCISKRGTIVKQTKSDANGEFVLEGISVDDAPGKIITFKSSFWDSEEVFTSEEAQVAVDSGEPLNLGIMELTYIPVLTLEGAEHHMHFEGAVEVTDDGVTTRFDLDPIVSIDDLTFYQGGEYWIDENNQLIIHFKPELSKDEDDTVWYLKAVGEEGYVADTWYLNNEVITPGQIHIVEFTEDVFGKVTYKKLQSDVVVPETQGTIAQTGDSSLSTLFFIIATLSLGLIVFACNKKSKVNL